MAPTVEGMLVQRLKSKKVERISRSFRRWGELPLEGNSQHHRAFSISFWSDDLSIPDPAQKGQVGSAQRGQPLIECVPTLHVCPLLSTSQPPCAIRVIIMFILQVRRWKPGRLSSLGSQAKCQRRAWDSPQVAHYATEPSLDHLRSLWKLVPREQALRMGVQASPHLGTMLKLNSSRKGGARGCSPGQETWDSAPAASCREVYLCVNNTLLLKVSRDCRANRACARCR